jgi:hypothetical protein
VRVEGGGRGEPRSSCSFSGQIDFFDDQLKERKECDAKVGKEKSINQAI